MCISPVVSYRLSCVLAIPARLGIWTGFRLFEYTRSVWIRIGFNADPDRAFYLNANPDQESQINADSDPGLTLMSKKLKFLHEKYI
jgi:hypothetical protein